MFYLIKFFQYVIQFTADLRKTTSVVFISRYCTFIRFSAMKGYLKVIFNSNIILSVNENLNSLLVVL